MFFGQCSNLLRGFPIFTIVWNAAAELLRGFRIYTKVRNPMSLLRKSRDFLRGLLMENNVEKPKCFQGSPKISLGVIITDY